VGKDKNPYIVEAIAGNFKPKFVSGPSPIGAIFPGVPVSFITTIITFQCVRQFYYDNM
jgi:hypothetical protein